MQSAVDGHYCPSCNHLMIVLNVTNIFGEYHLCPKPVTVTNSHLHQQHCPINGYTVGEDKPTKQEDSSISEMESDQSSLYSEGTSYEETGSDCNDSYNSLDDQHTVHTCSQCCTVGSDELVIPKPRNWSLSSRSTHIVVCRYCREEVKNCYYDYHLVTCVEHRRNHQFQDKQGHTHQEWENYGVERTRQLIDFDFVVNCIPVEESIVR